MAKVIGSFFLLSFSFLSTSLQTSIAAPSQKEIENHLLLRAEIISSLDILSPPKNNDKVENLLDELKYDSLLEMDENNLTAANLPFHPWSDSYWPLYLGILAFRYGDPFFPLSLNWQDNYNYLIKNLGKAATIDDLSPAEKYDLLLGNKNFSFTRLMLEKGRKSRGKDGVVPKWLGICHGWAPASFLRERPKRMVNVLAADGETIIPFYPSDIKALTTALWAYTKIPSRFIGGRCKEKNPRKDYYGRAINIDCLDTNPATWHLAVVNQLGYEQRTFIMDSVNNYEIWNYPVTGYRYTYFNPSTQKTTSLLKEASVDIRSFPQDKFKKFRSQNTKYIIGINMLVSYVDEAPPKKREVDNESFDLSVIIHFKYDLELDEYGKIIGGEWHSSNYPDFLWQPVANIEPKSIGDYKLDRSNDNNIWFSNKKLPISWRNAAIHSINYSQPLARIVENLLRFSNER